MDLIKEKFLNQLWDKTKKKFEESIQMLEENRKRFENEVTSSINEKMEELCEQYKLMNHEEPQHVVISYMRSSLIDGYPWYQINMYDKDFFYSDRETAVWLKIPKLENCLLQIVKIVDSEFAKQTRVEEYFKDDFLFTYGDLYHNWLAKHITSILSSHVLSADWESFYSHNNVCISFGEYKNQVNKIFDWGN